MKQALLYLAIAFLCVTACAQILSSSLDDPEVRLIIKKEVTKTFDGDYDVLLSSLHAVGMKNDTTFAQKLSNSVVATKSGCLAEEVLEHIRAQFPNLQVSVPVHLEDWDDKTTTYETSGFYWQFN